MLTPEPQKLAPPKEVIPYPRGAFKWLLRTPIVLYRLGLGGLLLPLRLVILTTRGRTSGLARHTPVEYRMHGSKIYLISAWGQRPNWVQNLLADPHVTVQAGPRTYGAQASLVENPSEILRAVFLFRKTAPAIYDPVLARLSDATDTSASALKDAAAQLTVIRLDITDGGEALPGVPRNLAWVWAIVAGMSVAFAALRLWRYWQHLTEENKHA